MAGMWTQLGLLGLALLLGTLIGAEREFEGKPAGMRTHAIIALGSALFTLASKYGFALNEDVTDTSRVAAQVVTGIGFLGAGVIFFNRNIVFGMTTAASIWATTAIAMACAAGMPLIGIGATVLHLLVVSGLQPLERVIGRFAKRSGRLVLSYTSSAALETALNLCTSRGYTVVEVSTDRAADKRRTTLSLRGRGSVAKLTNELGEIDNISSVNIHED